MDDVEVVALFEEFKEEFDRGAAPDVGPYLERAGEMRQTLSSYIDSYLDAVAPPPLDPAVRAGDALAGDEALGKLLSQIQQRAAAGTEGADHQKDERRSSEPCGFVDVPDTDEPRISLLPERWRLRAIAWVQERFADPIPALGPAVPTRRYGAGVTVRASKGDPNEAVVRVVPAKLDLGEGDWLVIVLRDENGTLMATAEVELDASASLADPDSADAILVPLDVGAAQATADGVKVIIAKALDAGSTGASADD